MDPQERQRRIQHTQRQFELHKMWALYWQTMASTGAATQRNTCQGREPTEEEKARGEVIGWRPLTDPEKIKDALDIMKRHLDYMWEYSDVLDELMSQ